MHLVRATGRAGRVRIRSPGKRSATGEIYRHGCRTTETQKAHPAGWAFYCLMPGSLWRASCPPPSGPLLRNVQIRSRRICPPSGERSPTDNRQNKRPSLLTEPFVLFDAWQFPTLHGETPHYHRRYGVSLLSSAWGQVGPPRYRRQANSVFQHVSRTHRVICIRAENSLKSPKQLRRCKVKPHGSLVPVSSTHRCAYTPGLSTSSSSTFLQET